MLLILLTYQHGNHETTFLITFKTKTLKFKFHPTSNSHFGMHYVAIRKPENNILIAIVPYKIFWQLGATLLILKVNIRKFENS